jgi:hypothetical protein
MYCYTRPANSVRHHIMNGVFCYAEEPDKQRSKAADAYIFAVLLGSHCLHSVILTVDRSTANRSKQSTRHQAEKDQHFLQTK